jgi:plasmid maintenance system antidote protein VapI
MSQRLSVACDTCGFVAGPASSAALAQRSLNLHSCTKHLAVAARKERGAQQRAAVDRAPKPCLHKQATHEHGTHACYVLDRCRCGACAAANASYERQRQRRHLYGRFDTYVDAQPVRDHVQRLMDAGIGLKRVAQVAGVSQSTLSKLIYGTADHGPTEKVTRPVAEKVTAVRLTLDTYAPGALVPNVGTKRRLQALMVGGWSQTQLARRVGMEVRNFNHLIHGKRAVTARTARAVADLYDELWDQRPPAGDRWAVAAITRSRGYALTHGFAPPLAWDDDTIDDPAAVADLGQAVKLGRGRPLEHVLDDIEWYLDQVDSTATAEQVATRLGYAERSGIQQACLRGNRDDLLERLSINAQNAGHSVTRRSA